jgi:hypothetical protein
MARDRNKCKECKKQHNAGHRHERHTMKITTYPKLPSLYFVGIKYGFTIEFDSKHQRLIACMNPNAGTAFGAVKAHMVTAWLRGKRGDTVWTIDDVLRAAEELEVME